MTTKLAYTFGSDDSMKYPGKAYVILETETPEQQRAFAAVVFGFTPNGAVNFAFDYSLDIFFGEVEGKSNQPEKYGLYKAAEFSSLPLDQVTCEHGSALGDLCAAAESYAERDLRAMLGEEPSDDGLQELYVNGIIDSVLSQPHGSEENEPSLIETVRRTVSDQNLSASGLRAVYSADRP